MMGKRRKQRVPIKTGRVVHHFWLNLRFEAENTLNNQVQELKKQRKFAETLRNGLRLILDLQAGSLSVLFELFPHLQERLEGQAPTPIPNPTLDEIKSMLEIALAEKREGDKYLMQSQLQPKVAQHRLAALPVPAGQGATGKTLGGFKPLDMPRFEDDGEDLPTIVTWQDTKTDSAKIFMQAMQSVQ